MSGQTGARAGRRTRVGLVLVVGLILVAGLLTWALGGFRAAPATGATRLPLGSPIQLARWTFVVQKVELANTNDYGGKQQTTLRLSMSATWHGQVSSIGPVWGLGNDVIDLIVPGGPAPEDEPTILTVDGYDGGFDPNVTRPLVLDFTWPPERVPYEPESQPKLPWVPSSVDVVIHDEYQAQNLLDPDDWRSTQPIGYVPVPVRDVRR